MCVERIELITEECVEHNDNEAKRKENKIKIVHRSGVYRENVFSKLYTWITSKKLLNVFKLLTIFK